MRVIKKNILPLHPLNKYRDVAQLVAHYVRDVGVGRSSRLIPTNYRCRPIYLVGIFFISGRRPGRYTAKLLFAE